jgi:hypothetical protein
MDQIFLCLTRLCACLTLGLPLFASSTVFDRPEKQEALRHNHIRRLPPSSFPELPKLTVKQLEALGCTIPQVDGELKSHNVIHGSFTRPGQSDWAVLCSRSGESSILVIWGRPTACPGELATANDARYQQGDASGHLVFSRQISRVNRDHILKYRQAFSSDGNGTLKDSPRLDHEGIEDTFVGKASEIHYCSQGKWQTLQGED